MRSHMPGPVPPAILMRLIPGEPPTRHVGSDLIVRTIERFLGLLGLDFRLLSLLFCPMGLFLFIAMLLVLVVGNSQSVWLWSGTGNCIAKDT